MQTALAIAASRQVDIPASAKVKCDAAPIPGDSLAEARAYGTLQTGYLDICDKRRQLAVDAAVVFNNGTKEVVNDLRPLRWWERVIGRARPAK